MSSLNPMHIPPPCHHTPERLTHAMVVFGNEGTLPAEYKCTTCEVRWFVDEPSPWPESKSWSSGFTDGAGNQMGIGDV